MKKYFTNIISSATAVFAATTTTTSPPATGFGGTAAGSGEPGDESPVIDSRGLSPMFEA